MRFQRNCFALASLGLVSCGGGSPVAAPPPALVVEVAPADRTASDLRAAPRDEELRDETLAALGRGDLDGADAALRALLRKAPDALGARSLISAVRAVHEGSKDAPHPFANAPLVRVSAVPATPQEVANAPRVGTAKVKLPAPVRDGWRRLGDQTYPHAVVRFDIDDPSVFVPPFLPRRLANNALVLVRPSDGRWIATYGRGHRDARFLAVLDAEGRALHVLDFAAWRAKNQIAEAGVAWAELEGSTLYVRTEIMAYDGFVAAVDLETGRTRWRSERLGFATNFALGDDRIAAWFWQPRSTLITIDKATGQTRARSVMEPIGLPNALLVDNGHVEAHGAPRFKDDEVLGIDVAATRPRPPVPRAPTTWAAREALAAMPLPSEDVAACAAAWRDLEADDPVSAQQRLRPVLERNPTSFAAGVLFEAARVHARTLRAKAGADVLAMKPVVVGTGAPAGRAPIARAASLPKLRVLEERETRRHPTAWFAESGVTPNTFERDASPSALPVNLEPTWLPSSLGGAHRTHDTSASDHAVAVYGANKIVVFRDGHAAAVVDASVLGPQKPVIAADVVSDVMILASAGRDADILAVDTRTGAPLWRAKGLEASSFVVRDGWVIAAVTKYDEPVRIVVLEGDTGKVVSRLTMKSKVTSYHLALAPGVVHGFDHVMSCKLAVE